MDLAFGFPSCIDCIYKELVSDNGNCLGDLIVYCGITGKRIGYFQDVTYEHCKEFISEYEVN